MRVEKVSMEAFSSAASSSKAPQPTASAAASSSALQPTASSALQPTGQVMASAESTSGASQPTVVTQMWTRIQKFGRFHKQFKVIDPDSEAQHEENVLFNFLHKAKKKGIPDDVWGEMRNYGASQPVDATQRLIDDIKKFRRIPVHSRTNTCERKLAGRLKKEKQNDRFKDAQQSELEKLGNDGPIALPDAARRDINEATLSWARGSNKIIQLNATQSIAAFTTKTVLTLMSSVQGSRSRILHVLSSSQRTSISINGRHRVR